MAQLNDLIVTGSSRFLVDINGNLNGNAATATTAGVATQATISNTNPTSSTTYFIPFVTSSGDQGLNGNNGLRYYCLQGTSSAAGWGELVLGNNTSTGTADNKSGWLKLFSEKNGQAELAYTASATTNTIHYLPTIGGTLLNTGNYMNYLIPASGNVTVDTKTSGSTATVLVTDTANTNVYGFVSAGNYHVAFKCYDNSATIKSTDSSKLQVQKVQNQLILTNTSGSVAVYIMITS